MPARIKLFVYSQLLELCYYFMGYPKQRKTKILPLIKPAELFEIFMYEVNSNTVPVAFHGIFFHQMIAL